MDREQRDRWSPVDSDGPLAGTPLGRAIDALPGVVMVLAGLTLVAMATLVPAWRELDRLDEQRRFIAQQAEALAEQERRYEGFHAALLADDPVLLERLAYTQLRREPIDRQTVPQPWVDAHGSANPGELPPGDIDRWLRVEPPQPTDALLADPQATAEQSPSRLVRLAGGTMRFVLLAAGSLCLIAGLWWGPRPRETA